MDPMVEIKGMHLLGKESRKRKRSRKKKEKEEDKNF